MGLFSKLKDYNEELETILDSKYFSSNVKNLLLSMIYKIENSYEDYKEVKRVVRNKEVFLFEIIDTIKLYCDNIKTVEPDTDQANLLANHHVKALTNEKERSILAYPTEVAFLYAVSDIIPKYYYMSPNFVFKSIFQNVLVDGFDSNNLEILNNFNGWSWDITLKEDINLIHQLIYQNLLMILGDKFLTDWRNYSSNKRDFLLELKTYLKSITGTNGYFKKLCQILFLIANGKEKKNLQNILDEKIKRLKQMENKEKFLQDAKNRKLKLTKQVEKIDLMLNDEKILIKQFVKKNEQLEADKRISSLRIFRNMMQKDRETYLNEISEIACLIKPNHFLKEKHELEEYQEIANNKKSIQEEMIALQKEFLKFMNKKISHLTTRDELVDMLYELRYYKTIFIDAQTCIKDVEILNNAIDKIMKKLITIACKSGIIKIISMDIALNYEIIKYALDTKIINLEGIKLYLEQDENYLMIKVYDNEIFEKQGRKKINASHKKLEVKYKKMIKIFN